MDEAMDYAVETFKLAELDVVDDWNVNRVVDMLEWEESFIESELEFERSELEHIARKFHNDITIGIRRGLIREVSDIFSGIDRGDRK